MADQVTEIPSAASLPAAGINYERLYDYRFRDVDQAGRQAVWREIARYVHARMIIGDIMDAELPKCHFDGVFLSNFLEHLPSQDAVADVLGKLRGAMAPGGRIAGIGPNFRYCAREYFDCADHVVTLT